MGPLLSLGDFLGPSLAVKPSLPFHPIVCSLVRKQEDVLSYEVGKMGEGTLKGLYGGLLSWTEGEPDFSDVANFKEAFKEDLRLQAILPREN